MFSLISKLPACILTLLAVSSAGQAVEAERSTLSVGRRKIILPAPAGLARCDGIDPDFDRSINTFQSAEYRLQAYFASPEDREDVENGDGSTPERSMELQTAKEWERVESTLEAFKEFRDNTKDLLKKDYETLDEDYLRTVEQGNEKLKINEGLEIQTSVLKNTYLGVFSETDAALGFTSILDYKYTEPDGSEEVHRAVNAVMMASVNGRVLYFHANFPYTAESDRKEAERAVTAWCKATLAANPQSAPHDAETKAFRIGFYAVAGLVVVGAIGFVTVMIKSR